MPTKTNMELEVQYACTEYNRTETLPDRDALSKWAQAAIDDTHAQHSIVIRIVDAEESRALNKAYRGKDRATNVLSFPFSPPPQVSDRHLGDLVICAPVVDSEASAQGKSLDAHWAHMVIHGLLHLQGHDHEDTPAADLMETKETAILAELGFRNPYEAE